MKFGMDALQKLDSVPYVELLVHPWRHQMAVRPSRREIRTSIKWATAADVKFRPKIITGAAFLPTLIVWMECGISLSNYRNTSSEKQ